MRHCAAVRARGWAGCKGEAWRGTELTAAAAAAQSNARLAAAETAIESSSAASSAGVQAARDMQGHRWLNHRSRRSLTSCEVEPQYMWQLCHLKQKISFNLRVGQLQFLHVAPERGVVGLTQLKQQHVTITAPQ